MATRNRPQTSQKAWGVTPITLDALLDNFGRFGEALVAQKVRTAVAKVDMYGARLQELQMQLKEVKQLIEDASKDTYIGEDHVYEYMKDHTNYISLQQQVSYVKRLISDCSQVVKDLEHDNIKVRQHNRLAAREAMRGQLQALHDAEGQVQLKQAVAELVTACAKAGMDMVDSSYLNFVFMAPPGTGKTMAAQLVAGVLSSVGILIAGKDKTRVRMTTKSDFVGQYVGETAPKTEALLGRSYEKVVVIGEAYTFGEGGESGEGKGDYGSEAITAMTNFLDKNMGLIILIACGYEDRMRKDFVGKNEGMLRRFPFQIVFESYDGERLVEILKHKLRGCKVFSKVLESAYAPVKAFAKEGLFKFAGGDMQNVADMWARFILSHGSKLGGCQARRLLIDYTRRIPFWDRHVCPL